MAISASQIVEVNARLLQPGGTDLELNGLIITQNRQILLDVFVMAFPDPTSVGDFFGITSDEYDLSVVYFQGYDNSFIKPRALYFAPRVDVDIAPFLRGGITSPLTSIAAITAGTFEITIGTYTGSLTGLDFSSIVTFSDAATILQTAIQAETAGLTPWTGATVTYSSQFNGYLITGGEAGTGQVITAATGTAADVLSLTTVLGAIASPGMSTMTINENMQAILDKTQNWVPFTTVYEPVDADHEAFAAWASGKGIAYLYNGWSSSIALTQTGNTSNIATTLEESGVGSTALSWFSAKYSVFILSCCACIDYERRAGAINIAFKSQQGLAANVNTTAVHSALVNKKVNFYGNYATRNDNFVFNYKGTMFGPYNFLDTYVNAVWLNNALQVALMNGLAQAGRVPYTEEGYALIRAWMQDPILRALNSGVIDRGLLLSEAQKAQIIREAGEDITKQLNADGYYIQVLDGSPSVRVNRDSPIVNVWYTYGGSVDRLVVASTAIV